MSPVKVILLMRLGGMTVIKPYFICLNDDEITKFKGMMFFHFLTIRKFDFNFILDWFFHYIKYTLGNLLYFILREKNRLYRVS